MSRLARVFVVVAVAWAAFSGLSAASSPSAGDGTAGGGSDHLTLAASMPTSLTGVRTGNDERVGGRDVDRRLGGPALILLALLVAAAAVGAPSRRSTAADAAWHRRPSGRSASSGRSPPSLLAT